MPPDSLALSALSGENLLLCPASACLYPGTLCAPKHHQARQCLQPCIGTAVCTRHVAATHVLVAMPLRQAVHLTILHLALLI